MKAEQEKNVTSSRRMDRRQLLKSSFATCALLGIGQLGFPGIVRSSTTLNIGFLPILDHMALLVSHAREGDKLKKAAITPKIFKSWNAVQGALQAEVLDGAFLLANFAMDIHAKGVGIKTVMVGHRHGSALTVGKNSGITSAADLKGKRIAIPAKISTHTALLFQYLQKAGLSLSDVQTRVIAPPSMGPALKGGSIDAFIVAEPFCEKVKMDGIGDIVVLSKDIVKDHMCCIVVVRDKVLQSSPDAVREWLSSLNRAGAFIEEDKTASGSKETALIAKKYMKHNEQAVVEVLQNPTDRITYGDLAPRMAEFELMADMSQKAGILGNVDLDRFVDDSFYKQAVAGG